MLQIEQPRFKAYNKKLKEIRDVILIDLIYSYVVVYKDDTEVTWFYDDIVLLKGTGINDRDGIELFEGDICIGLLFTMVFSIEKFTVQWSKEEGSFNTRFFESGSIIKIGNKYTNPVDDDKKEDYDRKYSFLLKEVGIDIDRTIDIDESPRRNRILDFIFRRKSTTDIKDK